MLSMKSRRDVLSILAVAAPAVVAGAVPALAGINPAAGVQADIDPIFAAIEKHRTAYAAFYAAVTAEGALDAELPGASKQSNCCSGDLTIVETDDPRWIAAQRATSVTGDAVDDAAVDICSMCCQPR